MTGSDEQRHEITLISNRGPVTFRFSDRGNLVARRGGGGLVTALGALAGHHDVHWVAHAMSDADVEAQQRSGRGALAESTRDGAQYQLRLVGKPDADYKASYSTIANPLLWFLQHRLWGFGWSPTITRKTHAAFTAYRRVNQRMADATAPQLDDSTAARPIVMIHDYHCFLVPAALRAQRPGAYLHFFLHIPWPSPDAWGCIPRAWVEEILASLLACDSVGFQTDRDAQGFIQCCQAFLAGVAVDGDTVRWQGRTTAVRDYPISLDVAEFQRHAGRVTVQRLRQRIDAMRPTDGQLIVRVDRTDPSKNIVRGFEAYGLMLHEHPELHERVTMFCQLDPSRQDVDEYAHYLEQIQTAADRVNIQFGTGTWHPLVVNLDPNFQAAVAAYAEYDVLFVNPVADGMNLVSKEGPLVNTRGGSLVLSEQAGSFQELKEWAIAVNPFDVAQQADALYRALTTPQHERQQYAESLRDHVINNDVAGWILRQLEEIDQACAVAE